MKHQVSFINDLKNISPGRQNQSPDVLIRGTRDAMLEKHAANVWRKIVVGEGYETEVVWRPFAGGGAGAAVAGADVAGAGAGALF